MRIIGGQAGGLQLTSPPAGVKPTMDRVREAIFSSIEPVQGLTIVDLFAGSGALGFEAISRGAARVAWVEQDGSHVRSLKDNLARVKQHLDPLPEMKVFQADVMKAPSLLADWQADIILADPPYNPTRAQKGSDELLTDPAFHKWAGQAPVIMEQSVHNPLEPACLELWQLENFKTYGNNLLYYLRAK